MAVKMLQGIDYKGTQPNFTRDFVNTKAELASNSILKNYPSIYEVFCLEDGCKYRLDKSRHEIDPVLGRWRKVADVWTPGGDTPSGGGTAIWYGTSEELTPEEEAEIAADTLMFVTNDSAGVTTVYYKKSDGKDLITELYTKSKIDTMFSDIIESLPYTAPTVSISTSKTTEIHGNTLENVTLNIRISSSQKYITIKKIELFVGDTLLADDFDVTVESTSYTYNVPVTDDTTFRLKVTDSYNKVTEKSVKIDFVWPTYTGILAEFDPENIDLSQLTQKIQTSKGFTWTGITCTNKLLIYMYPAEYGALNNIVDENNFSIKDSFIKVNKTIDGAEFILYYSEESCTLSNGKIVFS